MATTEASVVGSTVETHAPSIADSLTTQEKLLLAQAVYKVGAAAWTTISQLLTSHPICVSRPADTFSPSACEELYVALMTSIGQNVPAPDAMKPQNKIHLLLARTFYFARLEELKLKIEEYENRFTVLIGEINALKGGEMDEAIREEIKAATVKKYGPRVLQWIPDEKEVKKAIEDGPIKDGEIDVDRQEAQQGTTELSTGPEKSAEEAVPTKATVEAGPKSKSGKPSSKAKTKETSKRTEDKDLEQDVQPAVAENTEDADVQVVETRREARKSPTREKKTQISPRKGRSAVKEEAGAVASKAEDQPETDAIDVDEAVSEEADDDPKPSPAASELSPLPSQPTDTNDTTPKPVPSPSPAEHATRSSKRKASTQPRGAPVSKRGGRPRRGTSPAATTSDHQSDEETETVGEPEKEADAEPEETGRGRRQSKRHTRGHESPPPSIRTRGSSPATSRRAPSVSSSASTPVAVEEKRALRGKARGMRDEVVSKSVREQSAAVESAKEEEDDAESPAEEARPTRSSRRGKKEASPVEEKKDAGRKKRQGKTPTLQGNHDDDPDRASGGGDHGREAASATPVAFVGEGTKRGPRRSEPKDVRATQKILYNLLELITGHQHGGVFSTGVKKSDAPDYDQIIKKPMDLKKVKQRIRDGHITSIDEFERDVFLIFANAMMYNAEDSQVFKMAQEMFRATEAHIIHFRSMQADMGK